MHKYKLTYINKELKFIYRIDETYIPQAIILDLIYPYLKYTGKLGPDTLDITYRAYTSLICSNALRGGIQ